MRAGAQQPAPWRLLVPLLIRDSVCVWQVHNNLHHVMAALDLSKSIVDRIWTNYVFAMGYNLTAVPLAAGVLYPLTHFRIHPAVAGLCMALSSVSVVLSSLLLRRYARLFCSPTPRLTKMVSGVRVRGRMSRTAAALGRGVACYGATPSGSAGLTCALQTPCLCWDHHSKAVTMTWMRAMSRWGSARQQRARGQRAGPSRACPRASLPRCGDTLRSEICPKFHLDSPELGTARQPSPSLQHSFPSRVRARLGAAREFQNAKDVCCL